MARQRTTEMSIAPDSHSISALGLTELNGRVYVAVVGRPHSSVDELADRLALRRPEVGEVLRTLVGRSLIVRSAGSPARYQAVPPESALRPLVRAAKSAADEAERAVTQLEKLFANAQPTAHPASRVEVLSGSVHIRARVQQLRRAARHEIRTFDTPPYYVDPVDHLADGDVPEQPDVVLRGIYDRAALAVPGRLDGDIASWLAHGEQSRVVTKVPTKMVLFDDDAAVLPQSDQGQMLEAAYLVHPCSLLDGLSALFEAYWRVAIPLTRTSVTRRGAQGADRPDERSARLLALLAAGHTDASIARTLGLSPRTAQRRVQDLMGELGVESRFQAGVAAALRGWIS